MYAIVGLFVIVFPSSQAGKDKSHASSSCANNSIFDDMKRRNSFKKSTIKFDDVLSNLSSFSRDQLLLLANRSSGILTEECSKIVLSVPDEIWRFILSLSLRNSVDARAVELSLRLFASVTPLWSKTVNWLVADYFSNRGEPCFSPWVLSRSVDLLSIKLPSAKSFSLHRAFLKSIAQLTNLTSLQIPAPLNYQSPSESLSLDDHFLKRLTNLTHLEILDCYLFSNEAFTHLTRLEVLKMHEITKPNEMRYESFVNLPNLRTLLITRGTHYRPKAITNEDADYRELEFEEKHSTDYSLIRSLTSLSIEFFNISRGIEENGQPLTPSDF